LVVSRTASGNNVFNGMSGNDTLLGFGGNDWLGGGSGNDSLNGGAGQDLISGGIGADTLAGGPDADTFQFVSQYETAGSDPSGIDYANTDVILDFNPAQDTIDVHYVDANVGIPGDQDFDFIGEYFAAGGFTASGQAAYFNDGTNTYVLFNTDTPRGSFLDFDSPSGSQGAKRRKRPGSICSALAEVSFLARPGCESAAGRGANGRAWLASDSAICPGENGKRAAFRSKYLAPVSSEIMRMLVGEAGFADAPLTVDFTGKFPATCPTSTCIREIGQRLSAAPAASALF
jgi:hypothetical protein